MEIGFSGQALGYVKSFKEICKIGKKYGMKTCEIWECNAEGSGAGYINRDIKKLKQIAKEENIIIECVTLGSAFDSSITNQISKYVELLNHTIQTAANLGAKRVNHYCAHISPAEADFDRMEEFWAEPIKTAERNGIILALENEAHDATRTPDRMANIIQYFSNPYFKTNLDVTNYYQAQCDGYPDAYEILRDHIGYVHLKNACGRHYEFKYVQIPDGAVNIGGLLTRLIEDGSYDGLCSLEPHVRAEEVEEYYSRESTWLFDFLK